MLLPTILCLVSNPVIWPTKPWVEVSSWSTDITSPGERLALLCEHTRILGALVEYPQGNLEEIQQENPAEHPRGTCRPSGPQGLDVRHRVLRSQPCTASANTGEAIRTLFGQRLRPDPLLRGRTYVRTYPGASRGYSYVHGTEVTVCTGDSCYAEVGFNTIMYYVLRQSAQ